MNFSRRKTTRLGAILVCAASLISSPVTAERFANPVAVFSGIDKITGRITSFDVYIDETVQFGALQVTPKVCYSRDDAEEQKIDAFVEVDEITLDRKIRRIFSGWMFADSPGLNAVEHAIYDVWLTGCKANSDVPAPEGVEAAKPAPVPDAAPQQASQSVQERVGEIGTSGGEDTEIFGAEPGVTGDADAPFGTLQEPEGTPQPDGTELEVPELEAPQDIDEVPQFEGEPDPALPGVVPPGGVGLY